MHGAAAEGLGQWDSVDLMHGADAEGLGQWDSMGGLMHCGDAE
jgi:hypothetical protein